MASNFKRGGSILIPFRDGFTISDSQGKPRIYKTRQGFEKSFPKHYLGTEGIELVEYAEVVHAHWYKPIGGMMPPEHHHRHRCSACDEMAPFERPGREWLSPICPCCGAIMDGEVSYETN